MSAVSAPSAVNSTPSTPLFGSVATWLTTTDHKRIGRLFMGTAILWLLGVSGVSSDMRTLPASDVPRARLAIELYCYRIRREIGSLAAALGGPDALVFTGGVGENAAAIRAAVCRDARWLGVELDEAANEAGARTLHAASGRVSVWRVSTNEELMIAQHTAAVFGL